MKNNVRSFAMLMVSVILAVTGLEFSFAVGAARADSEAASEASSEAPMNGRRRRGRYRNYQGTNNIDTNQVRRERAQEAKERAQQLRHDQNRMKNGPQIKNYGRQHKGQGQGQGQGQQSQP